MKVKLHIELKYTTFYRSFFKWNYDTFFLKLENLCLVLVLILYTFYYGGNKLHYIGNILSSEKINFIIREKKERKNKMENKLCLSIAEVDTTETIKLSHINRKTEQRYIFLNILLGKGSKNFKIKITWKIAQRLKLFL